MQGIARVRLTGGLICGFVALCWISMYEYGQILLTYPFSCAALGALFPRSFISDTRSQAFDAGMALSFKALVVALIFACLFLLGMDTYAKSISLPAKRQTEWLIAASLLALVPGHFFFLFRVMSAPDAVVAEGDLDEPSQGS